MVNDPSNLGAVIRTAEAAGARGVIIAKGSADPFSPRSLRASMGSAFRMPIWSDAEVTKVLEWAREHQTIITATAADDGISYLKVDWTRPRIVVFGSEAHGVGKTLLSAADEKVRIPIVNDVESLNLAVSAGVLLFEARRQVG